MEQADEQPMAGFDGGLEQVQAKLGATSRMRSLDLLEKHREAADELRRWRRGSRVQLPGGVVSAAGHRGLRGPRRLYRRIEWPVAAGEILAVAPASPMVQVR